MRKIILTIALAFGAYTTTVNATELPTSENVTFLNYEDVTTFCKLIKEGNYEAVEAMINSGEDINKKSTGLTPLMFAARYNRAKIAKLLIDKGAKLKAKSNRGLTALKWAELAKANETMKVIEKAMKK
ncbi:ankyrin repeat domain-containing protein [uncultured Tenacibaculum sp.]|uniref:ankyrin repeat domain-containing protein n=1 Tax=uncultured Tenacibaculum sp. TaxID=174713 RepID=UPI0026257930|nr:ankyrin repeat domain-containing protein [uncultured Tenacibaculum sp.]